MKKELLVLTATLALVSSLSASVHNSSTTLYARSLSAISIHSQQIAREVEPGDNRGKDRKGLDDPKGHKFSQQIAREAEPGDNRGKDRKGLDDPKGHKLV